MWQLELLQCAKQVSVKGKHLSNSSDKTVQMIPC